MERNISEEIIKYEDEIFEDVIRLIRIPSIRGRESEGKPFGDGPAKALEYCLGLGEGFGFKVKNCGNYGGHIEYGKGDGLLGILAHVDVVPSGEGWTMQPFGGEIKDGRIYGRGAMDDKSEAVAAIYCLKTLKSLGIEPKMRIRVILGACEETGMQDMQEYFKTEELPDFAFTPDSEYPVCNREKGILRVKIQGDNRGTQIIKFEAGTAPNMVPASARVFLENSMYSEKFTDDSAEFDDVRFVMDKNNEGAEINCYGKAAHASTPLKGKNAAAYLIGLLAKDGCIKGKNGFFSFLDRCLGTDVTGAGMGISCSDAESGGLTVNLGIVHADEREGYAILDIRYPVTKKSSDIIEQISKKAEEYGLSTEIVDDTPPLFIPESSPLVVKLKKAYKMVMKQSAGTFSSGGGTYARSLNGRGVAFGAGFGDLSRYNIHSADEFLIMKEYMDHCRISLQAVYELACNTGAQKKIRQAST